MIKLAAKWLFVTSSGCVVAGIFHYLKSVEKLEESLFVDSSQPYIKWDHNWDKRDISSLIKQSKNKNDPEQMKRRERKREELTSTATRHIFLIRHGQYETWQEDEKKMKLTELGQKQAALVGQRLQGMKFHYTKLIQSTMTRAMETAGEIHKCLPDIPVIESSELLREGDPIPSEPPIGSWKEEYRYFRDGPRIEAAFRTYFHRAPASQKNDSYEIIVCHANVIRYFICRLLQVPPEAWLRFSLPHCSITWTRIKPNGDVCISTIGDSGFIPQDKLSRS